MTSSTTMNRGSQANLRRLPIDTSIRPSRARFGCRFGSTSSRWREPHRRKVPSGTGDIVRGGACVCGARDFLPVAGVAPATAIRGTMIRLKHVAAALLALSALNGCGNNGDSANPPAGGLQATPGDGTVVVTWADDLNIDYWLFVSTDSKLTTENFSTLTDIRVIRSARSPYVLCGYPDGRTLYLAMNGRTGGGPGGPGTPTINSTLRAAGSAWTAGTAPATDFNGAGYAPITTCVANALPTGIFTAVGPNAAIATSTDGVAFTARVAPAGFTTDLNAVAAFTVNLNIPTNPGTKIIAVGAGGASIVSTDGITWTTGVAFDAAAATLHAVAVNAGTFIAVGDGGVAQTTADGVAWTARTSNKIGRAH